MGASYLDLVAPAVAAVRSVLRDLDDDQIPADLRKIAAYAGGTLPPPLVKSVIKGLDRYEWLRTKAFGVLGTAGLADDGPMGASSLLLERPAGWSVSFAALVAAAAEREADGSAAGDRKRIGELERKLEAGKTAAKARIADLEAQVRAVREALEAERSARRATVAREGRSDASAGRVVDELRRVVDQQAADLEAARAEIAGLTETERALRRERRSLEASLVEATTGGGWLGSDPAAIAMHLDQLAALARVRPTGAQRPSARGANALAMPSKIRPDSREAIDWLLGLTHPVTVAIDGYNVGFQLVGSTEPGLARRRLAIETERLDRLANGPMRIVVIYDTTVDSEPARPGRPGPEIRFTEPGTSADEDIADLAASTTGALVVITSDRWVREVAEAAGAVGLWSEALVAWASAR